MNQEINQQPAPLFKIDLQGSNIPRSFGISAEREEEIHRQFIEYMRALKIGIETDANITNINAANLAQGFINVARNQGELLYCALQAGRKIEEWARLNDKMTFAQVHLAKSPQDFMNILREHLIKKENKPKGDDHRDDIRL